MQSLSEKFRAIKNPTGPGAPPKEAIDAFCRAAGQGKNDVLLQALAEHGAVMLNVRSLKSNTALLAALENRHWETAALLLEKGVEPNVKNIDGISPLMIAAQYGQIETLRLLLERGAEINLTNTINMNALIWAAVNGEAKTVEFLLERGAEVRTETFLGWTALNRAEKLKSPATANVIRAHLAKEEQLRIAEQERLMAEELDDITASMAKGLQKATPYKGPIRFNPPRS